MLDLTNLLSFWVALFDANILLSLLRNNEGIWAKSVKLISYYYEEWLKLNSFFKTLMSNFSWQISFCNSFNKYITFFFLIRLRFPKSQSISNILCRIYSQSTLKRIRKLEKLDYRLPSFLNFRVSIQSLKVSLTYKQCQLEHLEAFQNTRNDRHSNMSFTI